MNPCTKLNKYPTVIIPIVHININIPNNLGLIAFLNIIIDGSDNVVTAIIKDRTVPSCAPLISKASAIGIVPNISAYIGMPIIVAKTTPNGLLLPKILTTQVSGIQL